ncbi:MAG: long-chain fatty acid--CoA ligase [Proteobacteria bacterium]|nr:long-chain fatty acid--CoA ligase [Pseudomonadota bacterium]
MTLSTNSLKLDTFPKVLRDRAQGSGDRKTAMRVKDRGIWQSYTWKDYLDKVRDLCLGMVRLGLEPNDKICIIGENKPEWFWAELAAQCAGAAAVGVFTDCNAGEVKYFVEHSESKFVVAHDQEQVDKLLEIMDELPLLEKVIYWDPKGLWGYDHPDLLSMEQVMESGRDHGRENSGLFDTLVDRGKEEDVAVICYTSGTTGLPKGAIMNHGLLVDLVKEWSRVDQWDREGIEYLSFIPPAWATEQAIGIAGGLVAGLTVNFPEKPETVQENIREIGPEVLFYGARLWENVNSTVQARMIDSTPLRQWVYRRCLDAALKIADRKIENRPSNPWWRIKGWLAHQLVIRALRDRLGLTKAKVLYSAGGALSPEIIRFFLALGIEIKLFYGSTEMGVVSIPRPGEIRPETSGRPMPWTDVKISDEGEILVKSKFLFPGYYRNPEARAKKMKDDYYGSDDFGYIDDNGHLIVIDRMEDLKELSDGRKFSPQYCEVRLRFSPYIKDVLVVGGQRGFVSCLINIDLDNVGRFAESSHIAYTTFTDLSQKPQIIDLIKEEIRKVNRTLPEHARIERFVDMHKEFDADEAEMTRTRKLRRTFVEERYGDVIEALYGEREVIAVEAPITYRDGRKGVISTSININKVD